MKNYNFLKVLLLTVGLTLGYQMVSAQIATLAEKQEHQNTLPENYDAWKRSVVRGNEVGPNLLITTTSTAGLTTHTVQLGYNLADQAAADDLVTKISAQPGVVSVTADYTTNRVVYTVKDEDEHNSLESYFDIQ
jgi:hypothetical protein